jgi:hypothetical protein
MHMDDFDRLLALELARMLDPVVEAPPPPRRRRRPVPLEAVTGGLATVPAEVAVVVEPIPIALVAPIGPAVS